MPHLDNSVFLKQLKVLFESSQSSGSVYITFKGVLVDETKKGKKTAGEKKTTDEKKTVTEKKQGNIGV